MTARASTRGLPYNGAINAVQIYTHGPSGTPVPTTHQLLRCEFVHTDRRGHRSLRHINYCCANLYTRTVGDAGPYDTSIIAVQICTHGPSGTPVPTTMTDKLCCHFIGEGLAPDENGRIWNPPLRHIKQVQQKADGFLHQLLLLSQYHAVVYRSAAAGTVKQLQKLLDGEILLFLT